MRNPSKIPAFLSPDPVGFTAVYNSLHTSSDTNVKIIEVTAKGMGGISPPFDNALKKMPAGIETAHAGTRDFAASPASAVALAV